MQTQYDTLLYATEDTENAPCFYVSEVVEWDIIMAGYSRMMDVNILKKQPDNVSGIFHLSRS